MTIVAIHQPQYLPWIPYFAKAEMCDVFVYLDHVQYQKGGVQNRNQVKTANGSTWLTVPVRASLDHSIAQTTIATSGWGATHLRTIEQSYSRAAHLGVLHEGLPELLLRDWANLADLDISVTEWMCGQLEIGCRRLRSSQLDVSGQKDDLVIAICEAVGADEYLSGRGAMAYQSEEKFAAHAIRLRYAEYTVPVYRQCHPKLGFLPDMSALDLILNMGPEARTVLIGAMPSL